MTIGYMWLDENEKTKLDKRISEGYDYFVKKYGNIFESCEINPMYEDVIIDGLIVGKNKGVLKNHFYYIVKKELDENKKYTNPKLEKEN